MFEARFSVVICGSQEGRWTAYAFDDTEFDGEDLYEKMMGNCQPFHADPIASCIWGDDVNADIPIWNPREYFLIVVANRIARAANDWESLVGPVERSIREYVSLKKPSFGIHCANNKF
jgi:hypothetical protein